MPPNAQHVKMMRVLVKQTMGRSLTTALSQDIAEACAALEERGRLHPTVRKRVHSNTGF
jgi:glutamate decarboxylase